MLNALSQHSPFKWDHIDSPEGLYTIPFSISGQYDAEELEIIRAAMSRIEQNTCIRFRARDREEDFLDVQNKIRHGCYAAVGRLHGRNVIQLEANNVATCIEQDIVQHELMHVVGLWHEHMRRDRENFINIRYDNIQPRFRAQFDKVPEAESNTYGIKYNYRSLMHYGKKAFAMRRGLVTIETIDPNYQDVIGRAREASPGDYFKVCAMYSCTRCMGRPFNSAIPPTFVDTWILTTPQIPSADQKESTEDSETPLSPITPPSFGSNFIKSIVQSLNRLWLRM